MKVSSWPIRRIIFKIWKSIQKGYKKDTKNSNKKESATTNSYRRQAHGLAEIDDAKLLVIWMR